MTTDLGRMADATGLSPSVEPVPVSPAVAASIPCATAHTPGPWTVHVPEHVDDGDGRYWHIDAGDGFLTDEGTGFHLSGCVNRTDARLIGAAPELLEALVEIADAHLGDQPAATGGSEYDWAVRHIARLRGVARAAIAKATGQES